MTPHEQKLQELEHEAERRLRSLERSVLFGENTAKIRGDSLRDILREAYQIGLWLAEARQRLQDKYK